MTRLFVVLDFEKRTLQLTPVTYNNMVDNQTNEIVCTSPVKQTERDTGSVFLSPPRDQLLQSASEIAPPPVKRRTKSVDMPAHVAETAKAILIESGLTPELPRDVH